MSNKIEDRAIDFLVACVDKTEKFFRWTFSTEETSTIMLWIKRTLATVVILNALVLGLLIALTILDIAFTILGVSLGFLFPAMFVGLIWVIVEKLRDK